MDGLRRIEMSKVQTSRAGANSGTRSGLRCASSSVSLVFLLACSVGIAACRGPQAAAGEDGAGAEAPRSAAGTAGEDEAQDEHKEVANKAGPDKKWPPLRELPPEVRAVAAEAIAALDAGDAEAMTAVRIPFERYSDPRLARSLAKNPKAVDKVPAKFWWDNLNEDSEDDEERLRSIYAGKKIELVAARFGNHVDRDEVEMWDDVVVTLRVDGGEPREEMILGELVRDKKDGEVYLLRWHRRQLRSQ